MGIKESTSPLLNESVKPYYRDYICSSSLNNYQSLHITFYDNSSRCYMEVQLRTKMMDDVAEIGTANHIDMRKSRSMTGQGETQSRRVNVSILMRPMREE